MQILKPGIIRHKVGQEIFVSAAEQLLNFQPDCVESLRESFLEVANHAPLDEDDRTHLRLVLSVLCDLKAHDWVMTIDGDDVLVAPPNRDALDPAEHKNHVREGLRLERDAQLREPATQRFIGMMERRRLVKGEWKSIFSLMRDGPELSAELQQISVTCNGDLRLEALQRTIDPYVQIVERGLRCEHTGFYLQDVWRYFRHTWATPYRSVPGRQMSLLIRDRAAPNHPVIGIGALASSVVQQKRRDKWIGWHPAAFFEKLRSDEYRGWSKWMNDQTTELLRNIYIADFRKEGVITKADLTKPSPETIQRLRRIAAAARDTHRLYRQEEKHKGVTAAKGVRHWRQQAQTHLFRSKRAATVAQILQARSDLIRVGFTTPSPQKLRKAVATPGGRRAVQTILRLTKGSHVGIDMMDIIVCGAVAPYGPLLGGKLVSLLQASPDVVRAYAKRYKDASSVIASSMAGRPIKRLPRLVLLMTTSLYRVTSSQYNRLKVGAECHGGDGVLQFIDLEHTAGFGSYHFSKTTVDAMEVILARSERGREVNSIFGEGVNPKLRKARSALHSVGLPADYLLKHGAPRIIYAVPLATNFREVLIGRERRPRYIAPCSPQATAALIKFWHERWLDRRIQRQGVLAAVASHTTEYPVSHGARVNVQQQSD